MSLWWLAPDPPTLFYEALLIASPDSRRDGGAGRLAVGRSADPLRSRVRHRADPPARRHRGQRDRRPGTASAAGHQHCRAGRDRPVPRAVAARISVAESGCGARRGAVRVCRSGRDSVPCHLRIHGTGQVAACGHGQHPWLRSGLRGVGRCPVWRCACAPCLAAVPLAPECARRGSSHAADSSRGSRLACRRAAW